MFACTNKSVPETKQERYKQIAVYWFCSLPAMAPWSLWLLPFKAPPHVPMWRRPPLLGRRAKSAPGTLRGPISFGTAPWAWWRRRWRPTLRARGPTSPWRAKHAAFHHSVPFHTPDLARDHLADHPPKPLLRALLARLHELLNRMGQYAQKASYLREPGHNDFGRNLHLWSSGLKLESHPLR